jgi:hypothetical protein
MFLTFICQYLSSSQIRQGQKRPGRDKIEATINKLNLWCNRIEKEKYDSFHTLSDLIDFG